MTASADTSADRFSREPVIAAEGVALFPHRQFVELVVTDTTPYSTLTISRRVPWAVLIKQARLACPKEFAR